MSHTRLNSGDGKGRRAPLQRTAGLALMIVMCLAVVFLPASPAAAADCPDADGDGYVTCNECTAPGGTECGDCNDGNALIKPGATELCSDNVDNDCDGSINEGFHIGDDCALCSGPDCGAVFCIDGVNCGAFTGALCLTASLAGDGYGVVCEPGGMSETCAAPLNPVAIFGAEGLGFGNTGNYTEATCYDGDDNDCDAPADDVTQLGVDLLDPDCQAPEICDGLDNDGNGDIDELFPLGSPDMVGGLCSVGVGECARSGIFACLGDGSDAACGALPGAPGNEGVLFGLSCDNGDDDDCDGLTDLLDPDCLGFGLPELCGDNIDNDGDSFIDEGFPQIGLQCSAGVGACSTIGTLVCNGAGDGVECDAVPGVSGIEDVDAGTCNDFIDNDCDGLTDAADPGCGAAFADLGVTCSLPYTNARPGKDCTGKHFITFGADAGGVTLKADLLALGTDGTLLGIIEDVGEGEEAHLASRIDPEDFRVDTKTNRKGNRHTVFAPMPVLRVTGTSGTVEDVAYCSIMPWLEVTAPNGQTISLNESSTLDVVGFLPLVDVDSVGLAIDGVDILTELGIDPETQFPTNGAVLCPAPGDCVFQIAAGCGDGSLVDVEITNFRVEGLDRDLVYNAKEGVELPLQVNTFAFTISGLPAGGHIFYVNGAPLPLPKQVSDECLLDDLADAGMASAFGIQVDSPSDQQVVALAPVFVEGTVCGGNEIASLRIQGNDVPVGGQICTAGDGMSSADECVFDFSEPVGATDLLAATQGTAIGGTFNLGSNRVIADATDVGGNRTFNTDVIFGLGQEFQAPGISAAAQEASFFKAGRSIGREFSKELANAQKALGDEIDPAFVIGLEPAAVQDFFDQKCQSALDQFSAQASANLTGKVFAHVDFTPSCSCDLNNVPVVLESVSFPDNGTNPPGCAVEFQDNQIGVTIYLPDIRVQVGAHDSCTKKGLFGECIARTKINVTAVSKITDLAFDFVITEDGIENKTPPDPNTQVITWLIEDGDGTELFYGGSCVGGTRNTEFCISDSQCPASSCDCARGGDGQCTKRGKDQGYDPVTGENSKIECWGASVCNAFATVGAVLIEVFTLGFADGFEIVGIIDFDVTFQEDFMAEVDGAEPDPLSLEEVEIDAETVASFEQGNFAPGAIDVEIDPNGLKIEIPASFESLTIDPMAEETPGAVLTPAIGPSISALVAAGDEISIGIADDVFNQLFASMRQAGSLEAFCTDGDGLTVNNLLPFDDPGIVDDGCDGLGADDGEISAGDAISQGICHAVRGADCSSLSGPAKIGACTGFSGGDCTTLGLVAKGVCNSVAPRDIHSDDSVLLCARQDIEPLLLFQNDDATDNTVLTDLLLNDTNVVFAIDKAGDGYTGELEDLQGCFGEEGDASPDCLLYAVCLDLTLKTTMGIDNSTCAPTQTGFVFSLNQVITSGVQPGIMCSAASEADDQLVTGEGFDSVVIDTVSNTAEAFTPPFCADGLTLGGVLSFTGPSAKMFAITTDEATPGFADFLFLTGSLGSP